MAIGRARCDDVAFKTAVGDLSTSRVDTPTVKVYVAGTGTPGVDDGTPFTDTLYRSATGGTTYGNPFSGDAQGHFEFYTAIPTRVKLVVTGSGSTQIADYVPVHASPYDAITSQGSIHVGYFGGGPGR